DRRGRADGVRRSRGPGGRDARQREGLSPASQWLRPAGRERDEGVVMDEMKAVDLGQVMSTIRASGRPNTVLWQAPDSIAFVARGREFRSEFHSDPTDEVTYMIKGDMNLHYRTPEGDEKIAVIRE